MVSDKKCIPVNVSFSFQKECYTSSSFSNVNDDCKTLYVPSIPVCKLGPVRSKDKTNHGLFGFCNDIHNANWSKL